MQRRFWIVALVAVVLAAAAGFFGGRAVAGGGSSGVVTVEALKNTPADQLQQVFQQYAQSGGAQAGPLGGTPGGGSAPSGTGGPGGGGMVNGTVMAKDAATITIKLPSGSTKNVLYSSATTVAKSATGSLDDVAKGVTVMVTGSSNTDGSVTAERIQVVPAGQLLGLGAPGAPSTGGTTTTT
jgi:hypothetical protein